MSRLQELVTAAHPTSARKDVDLAELSRWRVGGRAAVVVEPGSISEVVDLVSLMRDRDEPLFVAGDLSNVLFDSRGFDGVILRVSSTLSRLNVVGTIVSVEAGMAVPTLARATADAGLSGLEHTVGIPGTIGGLVTMNGGSQRKGVGSVVRSVECVTPAGDLIVLDHDACRFSYRSSVLQELGSIVVKVDLELTEADSMVVHADMDAVVDSRRSRFPEDLPNCGSTFLSDPAMYDVIGPPGRAIEEAGLKGFRLGDAVVSPQHANFVVNAGQATSDDVLDVIAHVRRTVLERTGFAMDCEVRFVARDGRVVPAHIAAESREAFAA